MIGYPNIFSHKHYITIQIQKKNYLKIPHPQQASTLGAEAHAAVPLRHAIGQRQQRRAVGRQQIQRRRRRRTAVAQLRPVGAGREAQCRGAGGAGQRGKVQHPETWERSAKTGKLRFSACLDGGSPRRSVLLVLFTVYLVYSCFIYSIRPRFSSYKPTWLIMVEPSCIANPNLLVLFGGGVIPDMGAKTMVIMEKSAPNCPLRTTVSVVVLANCEDLPLGSPSG